ncbi:hypothetical protein Tco_0671296, partial [Tanacetum coccineum]
VHSFKVVNPITKHRVPIETSPVQVKEKSPERIHEVELEEDPEEDLKDDLEEEEEPKKKRLKEASESDSNTLPPDYTAPNKESETDLDFTARCETKHKELKNTCESSIQSKPDSPHTEEFKALLVEEFCPNNEMGKVKPEFGITP